MTCPSLSNHVAHRTAKLLMAANQSIIQCHIFIARTDWQNPRCALMGLHDVVIYLVDVALFRLVFTIIIILFRGGWAAIYRLEQLYKVGMRYSDCVLSLPGWYTPQWKSSFLSPWEVLDLKISDRAETLMDSISSGEDTHRLIHLYNIGYIAWLVALSGESTIVIIWL